MTPLAVQHHAPVPAFSAATVTMIDVMNNETLIRRLDGIDLYLWTRLLAATLVLVVAAGLAWALVL